MLHYWRERFPLHVFIPVAGMLAIAGDPGQQRSLWFAADVALALLLLATTRLWDDLADRERDAVLHPDRVLARVRTVRGYEVCRAILGATAATFVLLRPEPVIAGLLLGLLYVSLAVFYAVRSHGSAGAEMVLLSKYPAIVVIVAGGAAATRTLWGALIVYAGACAYEAWHDRKSALGTVARSRRILWQ